ncbi:peptidoglycan recognition protein family protein [Lolliginicoccus suaedae]|uniref:peptidoglycan recognition protein family protein n=1 Tax=Lolliginicoccus suaedae TaxID=2605429 RepID=UPI00165948EC|nr:N-acetylmuramoyl-L-alanine amidase [Lolliginicoccus suaedae]
MTALTRRQALIIAAATTTATAIGPAGLIGTRPAQALPARRSPRSVTHTASDGTTLTDVPLDGTSIARGPVGISSPSEISQVFEVAQDEPFNLLGVAWEGPGMLDGQCRARASDGTWGEWRDLHGGHGPNNIADPAAPDVRNGTELVFFGQTTAVQIHVRGQRIAGVQTTTTPGMPGGLSAVLVRPSAAPLRPAQDADRAPTSIAGTPAKPRVITRRQWGADESIRRRNTVYNDSLGGVAIHHTAGNNQYTESEARQIVRGIYAYHTLTLGWGDVGYHALVDKFGNIYEGRFGGMDRPVQGAHAGGFNENTAGFSMIGTFTSSAPSSAQITAIAELTGWRLATANALNPAGTQPTLTATGTTVMYSEGTSFTWVPQGQPITVPIVFAHRDVNNTECPGTQGYRYLGQIRSTAAAYMKDNSGGEQPTEPTEPSEPTQPSEPSEPQQPSQPPSGGSPTGLGSLSR